MRTRILIVLRAGADSLHRSWTHLCAGRVDVAISVYDDAPIDAAAFVATNRSPGGKFRGLAAFFDENAWVLNAYSHFWIFEDDLFLPFDSLLTMQTMIERFDFTLCAPSLTTESFMSWPITVQNSSFALRATDFVEVMAPVMSRAFLQRALPHFADNHTGWGYEWLWRKLLDEMNTFAAILDAAPIVHTRPIGKGQLYGEATDNVTVGMAEADELFRKHGIDNERAPFRNHFGLSRGDLRPVYGSDFLIAALRGYPSLQRNDIAKHERCLRFLMDSPRPLPSVEAILALRGAAALLSGPPVC